MIFFALTEPKKKLGLLLKVALLLLLLGVVIPSFYGLMIEANSLERFAPYEQYPGEPLRVEGDNITWPVETGYWESIEDMIRE
ncbi:MAG: hypothetical protein FWF85_10010 [Clostridiales bacterium]|jgi:hypothetical protein|nr:hypothetical protein [Clostridiales bacterium]